MEALKKAYAEIILNTAKEAAARTMASEHKALRFHHDLCNTKDEALRLLIRFKQIIDVKVFSSRLYKLGLKCHFCFIFPVFVCIHRLNYFY